MVKVIEKINGDKYSYTERAAGKEDLSPLLIQGCRCACTQDHVSGNIMRNRRRIEGGRQAAAGRYHIITRPSRQHLLSGVCVRLSGPVVEATRSPTPSIIRDRPPPPHDDYYDTTTRSWLHSKKHSMGRARACLGCTVCACLLLFVNSVLTTPEINRLV